MLQWQFTGVWSDYNEKISDIEPFDPDIEWRIKPKTLRYRVAAMFKQSPFLSSVYTEEDADRVQAHGSFIEWKSDWTEVEV